MKQTILAKELERQIGIEVTDNINSKIALQGMKKKQTYYVFGIKNHKFVRMLYCHKRNEIGSKIVAMGRMDIMVYYPISMKFRYYKPVKIDIQSEYGMVMRVGLKYFKEHGEFDMDYWRKLRSPKDRTDFLEYLRKARCE